MEVGDAFAAVGTVVDHEAESFFAAEDALRSGYFLGGEEEVAEEIAVFRGSFADPGDEFLGDDEDVDGRLGRDIAEGEAEVVFEDDVGGDLAGDDFFEQGHFWLGKEIGRSALGAEKIRLEDIPERVALEGFDLVDELADILELAVDGCVADEGDLIDLAQLRHDPRADVLAGDFEEAFGLDIDHDFVRRVLEPFDADGAFFAGFEETIEDFVAVELLADAAALDDAEVVALDLLVGGEPEAAFEALAAASDRVAVLGGPGIDHLILLVPAFEASHKLLL